MKRICLFFENLFTQSSEFCLFLDCNKLFYHPRTNKKRNIDESFKINYIKNIILNGKKHLYIIDDIFDKIDDDIYNNNNIRKKSEIIECIEAHKITFI